ncbi:MAG: YibE/F family protein [Oscillospiraceae bacterium]|nr:YibE/F family protein [Oscillospiraceae bacterium]
MEKKNKRPEMIKYVLLTVFAVAVVVVGCLYATKNAMLFTGQSGSNADMYLTKVDVILSHEEYEDEYTPGQSLMQTAVRFTCHVIYGEKKGESMVATQYYDDLTGKSGIPVEPGDWIYVYPMEGSGDMMAGFFFRIKYLAVLFVILFVILLIFARLKGIATMMSLGLTILSVFFVFIPAILSGYNVYFWTILVCLYSIIITPPFIGGFNKKSLASIVGSVTGVAVAGALTAVMNSMMKITGFADEDDVYVTMMLGEPIDMRAITFAAILIGALGSTLDVSMSIAASVWEMHESTGKSDFRSLLASGFNIGRDILGTQISTLVLAYIGSSLCTVLLYVGYTPSLMQMLNLEGVIIKIFDSLIGATTIILTIPFTAIVSAAMLAGENKVSLISEGKRSFRIGHNG